MFKTDVITFKRYVFKRFNWPCSHSYRQLTFIVTSLKTEKWRPPTLCCKVNYMWNHIETGWNSNHFRRNNNMYITHSMLYLVSYNLILFSKFATNRKLPVTCVELMRKVYRLGRLLFLYYIHLEKKNVALHLNKLESSPSKHALC